jgi:DNA-binding transcriptional LysR family regulator
MVDLRSINLNRLLVLNAVVEAGSLTGAGHRLGMANTMVSRHMQLLEAEIGVSLLTRSTRRLALTEAGRAFHEASRAIAHSAEQAVQLARTGLDKPSGTLRVASAIDYGTLVVTPLLARLRQRYPELKVELVCGDHLIDLITEGIDVAVRLGKLADSSLRATEVGGFVKSLVASPDFVAAHGMPKSAAQLAQLPFIELTVLPQPLMVALENARGKKLAVRMSKPVFSTNTANACRAAALAGEGVALLTDFAADADVAAGRLVRLMPAWASPRLSIHALFPDGAQLQQKVRVLIDALKAI